MHPLSRNIPNPAKLRNILIMDFITQDMFNKFTILAGYINQHQGRTVLAGAGSICSICMGRLQPGLGVCSASNACSNLTRVQLCRMRWIKPWTNSVSYWARNCNNEPEERNRNLVRDFYIVWLNFVSLATFYCFPL